MPIPLATWVRNDLDGEESYAAQYNGCRLRIWKLKSWHWSAVYIGNPAADVAPGAMTDMGYGIAEDSATALMAAENWAAAYRPKEG